MGKWSKYKRKYCTEWEKEPEFKDWIQKIITDETKVFCKYCHCEIRAHRTDLTAHGKTRKHHRNASPFSYMRTLFDAGCHQQDVPVMKPVMNVVELQLPVELALQTQDYLKELIGDISEKSGHTVGIMDLETTVKKIIPPLTSSLHKGQAGRIGIIGGCQEYTGAPYFAAISALKVGADLSHVFCTKDAAPVIKSYSPELIVHPILDHPTALEEFDKWLPRIHTLVVGPGLGRDPKVFETVASVIVNSKARGIPLVIDADGLFLITESPHLISKYQNTLLTPNIMEFQRLFEKMVGDRPSQSDEMSNVKVLAQCLGNVTILRKGCEDIISDGISVIKCSTEGSPRRCGGQGDLLSGASGVFLNWALSYYNNRRKEPSTEPAEIQIGAGVIAGFMACRLTRECSRLAYTVHGRSMTTTEMIGNIHTAFEVVFCT